MSFRLLSLCFFLFKVILVHGQLPQFQFPLKIPVYLSGNFGELRPNHFHAGLDMKSPIGSEVVAADTGWVSRIKVGLYGYGKVLYIDHPNGYTTVYAHLHSFNDEIEDFVRKVQYREEQYDIQVYPGKGILPVSAGETVAYSGNTGGSAGPHLHFEIRETETEVPRNPQLFGVAVKDEIKPIIQALAIYPLAVESEVNGSNKPSMYSVFPSGGKYKLNARSKISINGPFGIGVATTDRANGASNQNGTFRVRLLVDNMDYFGFTMDSIPFHQSRALNAHVDYDYYVRQRQRYQRLFQLQNNPLEIYHQPLEALELNEGHHEITIACEDFMGNVSEVSFGVDVKKQKMLEERERGDEKGKQKKEMINPTVPYFFESEGINIKIPANTLYRTEEANLEASIAKNGLPFVKILDYTVPFHHPVIIEISPDTILPDPTKWMVAQVNVEGKFSSPLSTTYESGKYRAESKYAGYFSLVADSTVPAINPVNFSNNKTFRSGEILFTAKDALSGIQDFDAYVDGKWVLLGYEPKDNLLFLNLRELQKSSEIRQLKLIVKDGLGNVSTFEGSFYYN